MAIELEDLAQTAYTVWNGCFGLSGDWETCTNKDSWNAVAQKASEILVIPDDADLEIDAKSLAKRLGEAMLVFLTGTGEEYDSLPENHKLAWNAVGRHLGNILVSDGQQMQESEQKMIEWYKARQPQEVSV